MKATSVEVGEGEEEPGTVIFPNDPEKTAEILWKDSSHGHIKEVRINGSKTNWRTEEGITLGTSLHELEKLNQGPVRMAGFDWDYTGTVIDCAHGELAFLGINKGPMGIQGRTLVLRLEPGDYKSKNVLDEEYCAVVGDGDFISNSKDVMKKLNPTVYEIIAIFP